MESASARLHSFEASGLNKLPAGLSAFGVVGVTAWAGGALFDDDANGDGVDNGLAFLLGATGPNAAVPARTMSESGGNLIMTFSARNDASRGSAILNIQHSSDLGIGDSWVSVPVTDAGTAASGVTFSITPGSPNNTVTATISNTEATAGKLFGRLKAEQP